jgi:hypothetical protein
MRIIFEVVIYSFLSRTPNQDSLLAYMGPRIYSPFELKIRIGESVPTPTVNKTPDRRERGILTASQALLTDKQALTRCI